MYLDVDSALAEVPVNIAPLIDDTDFVSIEESVAYNASGMDLIWHFLTTSGAYSATPVTPTTGGDYDWTHQDGGMYTIEIPASGGASINNDTEGFGWFTGVCDGVLPWRGPTITFRAAGLNNALIDNAYSTTRGLAGTALPDAAADAAGGLPISDAGGLDLDAKLANTNEVTAARMQALTDLIDGGRLDLLIDAIKAKTDNLPASPAAVGSEMDLVNSPNSTALTAIGAALEAMMLDEGDATALLAAISAKVEEFLVNEGDATATIAAIAAACNSAIVSGTVGTNVASIKSTVQNVVKHKINTKSTAGDYAQISAWVESNGAALSVTGSGTAFTAAASDTITSAGHGLSDGDVLLLTTTDTLPAGLSVNTPYYVISATTNTFELSATSGGSAVDITDAGTGTHSWHKPTGTFTIREHGSAANLFSTTLNASHIKAVSGTLQHRFEAEQSSPNFTDDRQYLVDISLSVSGTTYQVTDAEVVFG